MDKIEELLTRGVENIYPSREDLEKVLRSGKKLKLYQGFDPTGIQLHIGHMVGFRKLKQWQDLGHHVIFLIGDGTGQAGDPSGKKHGREKFLTRVELRKNAVDYVKQAGRIVRFDGENPVEILFNGDWLNKLRFADILNIAGNFSLQQLSERDLFEERKKAGEEVNLREFFYPLLQAYDSVVMDVDLEVGGNDQTFNMLCGRTLMKKMKNKDKFVMTTPLLTDSKGVKIGKTEKNVIALTDAPSDLFGKIMALSDDLITKGLEYLTDVSMEEIKKIDEALKSGKNPVVYKKQLAFEIVKQLNTLKDANQAQTSFENLTQKKQKPTNIPIKVISSLDLSVEEILVETGLVSSKSEAKRVREQGGVKVDGKKILNPSTIFSTVGSSGATISVGPIKFVKIKIK